MAGCNILPTTQRVEVPVPVPCRVAKPLPPAACVPRDQSRPEWLRCALADAEARRGYEAELVAALAACTD